MSYPVHLGVTRNTPFKFSKSFGGYLGVVISLLKPNKRDFFVILEKMKDIHIKGWQAKLLNMAGRSTLIKSFLNTYQLYSMQTSIVRSSIISSF